MTLESPMPGAYSDDLRPEVIAAISRGKQKSNVSQIVSATTRLTAGSNVAL